MQGTLEVGAGGVRHHRLDRRIHQRVHVLFTGRPLLDARDRKTMHA
ncbi:hypothetical protein [Agromyces ramosus]|jgi:hypothetical protein|nr:hypothetical protein [Agromyces ramosus]